MEDTQQMMMLETTSAWMKSEEVQPQEDCGWINHAEVSTHPAVDKSQFANRKEHTKSKKQQ